MIAALLVVWALQGSYPGAEFFPVGRAATIAVGMTLQASPSLPWVSSSPRTHPGPTSPRSSRVFPTNPLASVLTALSQLSLAARVRYGQFRFSVPSCAGVPLSAATHAGLLPAINPLVFASTLYAFGS